MSWWKTGAHAERSNGLIHSTCALVQSQNYPSSAREVCGSVGMPYFIYISC